MNGEAGAPVRCAICGSDRTRTVCRKFGYRIARCSRCGLVYASPRAPSRDILARYNADYFWSEYLPAQGVAEGRYDLATFDRRYEPILELLGKPAGRRLLEVGSGAGFFLKAAERRGWSVAGIELSPTACEFARERLGLDVRQQPADEMSFASDSFDVAVMFDVIEHVFDPRAVLEAVRSVLVPGGTLAILTPNYDAFSRLVLGADWAILSPLEHLYYFNERTLAGLLAETGFGAVRFHREYGGWNKVETMNYRNTHKPAAWRARVYEWVVMHDRGLLAAAVRRMGRADALLATCVTAV